MMVLTAPSNILIFWGLCFFLYSRISCSKTKGSRERTEKKRVRKRREECRELKIREQETEAERLNVPAEKMIKCIQVAWRERESQRERGENTGQKTLFNGCLSQPAAPFQSQQ